MEMIKNKQILYFDKKDLLKFQNQTLYVFKAKKTSYVYVRINNKNKRIHRLILNAKLPLQVDHINGNGLDNRRKNLRLVTSQQNNFNRRPVNSKYKGVAFHKRCNLWEAKICINQKRMCLGFFKTAQEAARAYNLKAKELFGEFAYLNTF